MKKFSMDVQRTTTFEVYHASSGSDTSTSSSSSTNSDTPLKKFNRLLRSSVARHWSYFRKIKPQLRLRGRSSSDAGLCSIVDNDSSLDFMAIPETRKRRSYQQISTRVTVPKLMRLEYFLPRQTKITLAQPLSVRRTRTKIY